MTRAYIVLATALFVACNDGGDELAASTPTDPSTVLDVPPPEVDTALPDFDSDTDSDLDTDSDSDSDSATASTAR